MQTDRQDLDKRYINLLCVEPHIAFPPCDGSLKLTEYGFDVSYENETDCADVNKTCTIIDKFISKRPEAGDPGGLPDVPIPEPVETGDLSGDYSFGKSSELDDGRLLTIHYGDPGSYKLGLIELTLFNIPVSGDPVNLVSVSVETPGGSPITAREAIDVITFGSDTFVIAYYDIVLGESKLLKGSISGLVITFDEYITKIADERMYQVNFSKFDSDEGFALFVNKKITTASSMVILAYTYSGGIFTEFITKQALVSAFPSSLGLPGPPLYDPPDACGGEVVYNYAKQHYGFSMALIKETANYYQFAGGYMQSAVVNYVQILNAFSWCFTLPAQINKVIFVPTTIKMYKDDGAVLYWHSELYWKEAGALIGYLEFVRLGSTERVVGVMPAPGSSRHMTVGLKLSGNYAIPRRTFKLPSEAPFTNGAVYNLGNEYFAIAVTGDSGFVDFYPAIWLEDGSFFGYLGEDSKIILTSGNNLEIKGLAMSNGRVFVSKTYYGFHGKVHLLDVSYV